MIRAAGNHPHALTSRRRVPVNAVRAGGGPVLPTAAPASLATPAPVPSAMQQLLGTLWSALNAFVSWLRGLFKAPAQPVSFPLPPASGTQAPRYPVNPLDAPLAPLPGMNVQTGQVAGGVGLTQVDGQPAVGARVEARTGDTLVSGAAAVTRTSEGMAATVGGRVASPDMVAEGSVRVDAAGVSGQGRIAGKVGEAHVLGTVAANPQMAAGGLTVAGPRVQGAVAGVVTKESTMVAGDLAARVGQDGALRAAGLYRNGPDGVHANLQAAYQAPKTEAGLRYAQDDEMRAAGAYLNRQLPHSSLSLGADYLWSPQGDGGRAYGRWQSDAIGERVAGFTVKGAVEAGAVKLPGQDWNTYAAGRVTAEKDNAALFAEIDHKAGPGFSQPDASLKFGAQFRF